MKIFAACLILGLPLPLLAADWPNWQGPNFNGISLEDEWDHEKIGNIIWKSKVGVGFAGVAVSDGKIFTLGHDGRRRGGSETVYCLDAKTGKKIWLSLDIRRSAHF